MVGLGSTNFFRNLGIACLLYTNDRLYGESFATEDYWSRPSIEQDEYLSFLATKATFTESHFVRRTYVYCPSWLFPWIKEMHVCSCNNYRIAWYAGRVWDVARAFSKN